MWHADLQAKVRHYAAVLSVLQSVSAAWLYRLTLLTDILILGLPLSVIRYPGTRGRSVSLPLF